VPALKRMVQRDTMLVARFHALWTLEGLGALDAALVREQMSDRNPRMRIQAIRASETLYKNKDTSFAADYRKLARDPSVDVVIQAMMTMNTLRVPDASAVVKATMAANTARGVQLVGAQLLNPATGFAGRNFPPAQRAILERGATAFKETCSQCHGETGLGTPVAGGGTVAPAFAGSPRVTGHPDWVTNVLLHGLTGPIAGKTYAGQIMVSQAQQSDEWIAAVASYIRNNFTNSASFVTPAQVAALRASTSARTTAWTYPELASRVPVLMQQQSTWKASASQNGDLAVRAFGTAGWNSIVPQAPGMWYQFELPQPVTVAEIQLQSPSPFNPRPQPNQPAPIPRHPRAYRVQVSMDGTTWSAPVAEGQGSTPTTVIAFAPVKAKFVRITETATPEVPAPWYMQQIQLYEIPAR